jgi:hypothetical protein
MGFHMYEGVGDGNGTFTVRGPVSGLLEAISISDDADASNVAKTVQIVATLAEGLTFNFGAPTIVGNTPIQLRPRVLANNAADFTTIANVYERYWINGKVSFVVASADAGDITRVRLIVEQ